MAAILSFDTKQIAILPWAEKYYAPGNTTIFTLEALQVLKINSLFSY